MHFRRVPVEIETVEEYFTYEVEDVSDIESIISGIDSDFQFDSDIDDLNEIFELDDSSEYSESETELSDNQSCSVVSSSEDKNLSATSEECVGMNNDPLDLIVMNETGGEEFLRNCCRTLHPFIRICKVEKSSSGSEEEFTIMTLSMNGFFEFTMDILTKSKLKDVVIQDDFLTKLVDAVNKKLIELGPKKLQELNKSPLHLYCDTFEVLEELKSKCEVIFSFMEKSSTSEKIDYKPNKIVTWAFFLSQDVLKKLNIILAYENEANSNALKNCNNVQTESGLIINHDEDVDSSSPVLSSKLPSMLEENLTENNSLPNIQVPSVIPIELLKKTESEKLKASAALILSFIVVGEYR